MTRTHGLGRALLDRFRRRGGRQARLDELERRDFIMDTVLRYLPIGVWFQDRAGRIVYGNPAAQRIWAGARYVGPEEFNEYKGWWVSTGKRIEAHEWAAARAISKGEVSLDEEIEIERFDGARRFILNSAFPVKSDGEILGAVIVNEDVTERWKAEESVREKASLIDLASDAIIVRGLDARVRFWSKGAERTYGWSSEEALGKVLHELLGTRFPVSLEAALNSVLEKGEWRGELRQRRKDGSEVVTTSRAALARSPDGSPRAILMINRDITERKNMEGELLRANAELDRTLEDLNRFTYSAAHDLRAPARAINGLAHQIDADPGTPPAARALARRVIAAARSMSALIESQIDLSRVMRGGPPEEVDLAELVREAHRERRRAEPERRVAVEAPGHLYARAPRDVARVVLARLFDNAWKFSSRNPDARIEFGRVPGREPPTYFMRDNGIGFEASEAGRIFTPFNRLHAEYPGHGLGMTIIRRGVEGQGGRVWAEGTPGRGACFYFTLGGEEGG